MGNTHRAGELAAHLSGGDGFLKRWLFQIFDKCGNCEHRLNCVKPLINSRGNAVMVYGTIYNCEGAKRQAAACNVARGDGKHAARLLIFCAHCVQLEKCVQNVINSGTFMGLGEYTSYEPKQHVSVIQRCASCPRIEICMTGVLRDVGFSWTKKLKAVSMFAKCKLRGLPRGGSL